MNSQKIYLVNNDCFKRGAPITPKGLMLHSVGCSQPKASVFIKNWNRTGIEACVHGFIEANGSVYITLPCTEKTKSAMRGWHAGGNANNTHLGFEMTEPNSITYTKGAAWVDKNPTATKAHVLGTYETAVELFSELCKLHGLDPLGKNVIISHAEGYRLGLASNHGDVEHIWNKFGLTMNQFRKDVAARLNKIDHEQEEEDMTQEKFNEMMNAYLVQLAEKEPSAWSKEARQWAENKGIINGSVNSKGEKKMMYRKFLTREEVAQILFNINGK